MKTSILEINGTNIFQVSWDVKQPKGIILIVHGYAEHSLRYSHVAEFFNEHNYTVHAFDFIGHGQSDGLEGYVEDFDEYVLELEQMIKNTQATNPEQEIVVLAHSMGGVVAGVAAAKNRLGDVKHLVLSNPGLDIASNQPAILVKLIRLLSKIAPKIKTTKLSNEYISRDPKVRSSYDNDPLNYRGGTRPRFANEFDQAGAWLRKNASKIQQAVLLNYSLSDQVVNPKASETFFENIGSEDKSKIHYEGLYHELLNEPEKEEVMSNILKWCEKRI